MNKYSNTVINYAFRQTPLSVSEIALLKDGYTIENANDLKETLRTKKVRPVVGKMMVKYGVDVEYWRNEYESFRERNMRVVDEVDRVFDVLSDNGINRIFAYENFGALLSSDTDIALFSSGDVDLFADVAYKSDIERVMMSLGYRPTQDIFNERSIMTEFLKEGSIIRVNIDWIILRRMMFPIGVNLDGIIDWDNLRPYKQTHIQLPSDEALLYLCLLRIAVHGFSRSPDVRLYIDVTNAVCKHPDWEKVIYWAKRDGYMTKITAVSYIAHHLNGVYIPESILTFAEKDADTRKIVVLCYDKQNRTLKYDPAGMDLIKVEAASDNCSLISEMLKIFFPSPKWLSEFYKSDDEPNYKKYINYYKRLIGK